MVIWTARHRAFVVEAFFKSGDSIMTTQRLFRREFNVPHHGAVPSPVRKARTPENIEYAGYSFSRTCCIAIW